MGMYRYYLYLFYGLVITFQTCSKGIKCYILLLSKDINVDKDENKLKSIEYELTEKDKNKIEEEEEEEEEEDRIKKREEYVKKLARKIAENNINIYDKNKIASILNNNKDDDEFIKSIFKHFDLEVKGVIKKKKETKSKEIKSMSDLTTKNFDYIEINFFQKQDNQDSAGITRFHYDGSRTPVQIFGTVKVNKGEKSILGAKLIKSNCNYVLYHRANVIHSFLYLTGKLKEKSGNIYSTSGSKRENWELNPSTIKKGNVNDDIEDAIHILNEYAKKDNQISARKLEEIFRKFGPKTRDIINKLVSDNKLIDNDDTYEII